MTVNQSKMKQARFWKKWIESGAVGNAGSKLHYCMSRGSGVLKEILYKERINSDSKNMDKIIFPLEFTISRIHVDYFESGSECTPVYFDVPESLIGKPVEVLHSYWNEKDGSVREGVLLSSNGNVISQQ